MWLSAYVDIVKAMFAGISSSSVFNKTDKTKPLGAAVSALNVFAGQPVERGASPLLYAAASPDLDGKCPCKF